MGVDVVEVTQDRPDLVEALTALRGITEEELNPGDPPPTLAEVRGALFEQSVRGCHRGWVAMDGDAAVAELDVDLEANEDNRHIATLEWLATDPGRRREGVATEILRAALEAAAADGRTSLLAYIPRAEGRLPTSTAAETWAERLGMTRRIEERLSRLVVDELDQAVVDAWQAEGRARTDGYRLVQFLGTAPDEHLDVLVDAQRAMGDMPIDDMEWTHPTEDAAYIRSTDESRADRGLVTIRTIAVAPDGTGAAVSELHANTHRPTLGYQGDTGVTRDHRGRGLGRWIKAENLALARTHFPEMAVIETYNAESNPWMLDINVAMGFKPHIGWHGYQGDLATALETLG